MHRRLAWLVVAACGAPPPAVVPVPRAPAVAIASPRGAPTTIAPHDGEVAAVAVTDDGRAALSVDDHGGVRLWPTLDGTREPVVIQLAAAPRDVALARSRGGFLAAAIDPAGGLDLLALDAAGGVVSRAQLPTEPRCRDIAAVRGDILAIRDDESIVRVDANGRVVGRVVAPPHAQIASLAVRGNRALAVFAESRTVRWLALDDGLAWGDAIELPFVVAPTIALSPDGHRLAAIAATSHEAAIVDLAARPTIVAKFADADAEAAIGFVDAGHALVRTDDGWRWWPSGSAVPIHSHERLAFGDDVAVTGEHGGLAITNREHLDHLGYHVFAKSLLDRPPRDDGSLWLRVGNGDLASSVVALRDHLDLGNTDPLALQDESSERIVIGERFSAVLEADEHGVLNPLVVERMPARRRGVHAHPSWPDHSFDRATRVLGFVDGQSYRRFRLDSTSGTFQPLPTLRLPFTDPDVGVAIADPALGGAIAVAVIDAEIATFLENPKQPPIHASFAGRLVTIDRAGTVYSRAIQTVIATTRAHSILFQSPFKLAVPDDAGDSDFHESQHLAPAIVPSHDTRSVALLGTDAIAVVEPTGQLRWQRAITSKQLRWTVDDSQLIVVTTGGVLALDRTTGATLARRCGWEFGRTSEFLPDVDLTAPNVCEGATN